MTADYGMQPVPDEFPQMRGLFVGGCVARGVGSSFRARAHAHTGEGPWKGWVCVRSPKRLWMADGRPSRLLWHEYAHIVSAHGHDAAWRNQMKAFGQPLPRQYKPRKRQRDPLRSTIHGCYLCGQAGGGRNTYPFSDGHWYHLVCAENVNAALEEI